MSAVYIATELEALGEEVALFFEDGKWTCMIGNPCPAVWLGEAEGRVTATGPTIEAAALYALLLWERNKADLSAASREISDAMINAVNPPSRIKRNAE